MCLNGTSAKTDSGIVIVPLGPSLFKLSTEVCKMANLAQKPIDTIKCPSCGKPIPITQTLRHQLSEEAKADLQQEIAEERQALVLKEKELQAKEAKLQDSEKEITSRV